VLRKKAGEVSNIDGELLDLAEGMVETLTRAKGLGLAAPQVGRSVSLCVINLPAMDQAQKRPLVLINPRVTGSHGRLVHQEGCLSFPELYAEVARPQKVGIAGVDLSGREMELEADEMLARCFLHEIDHLNGVLFIDHLSQLKRQLMKSQLRRISRLRGE
jgi:peptide deformylase